MTNQRQINALVDQMAAKRQANLGAQAEDHVSTQVAAGSDQARAMAALANELGDPMEMDGTVEIQNPMKVWQQAQNALNESRAAAAALAPEPDDDDDDDWDDDFAATEVVDASALNFAFNAPRQQPAPAPPANSGGFGGAPQIQTQAPPTQPPAQPAYAPPAYTPPQPSAPPASQSGSRDSSAYGSGQFPPNTPPGGRNTSESWGDAARQSPSVASGFQRSPSGLTSAALFGDEVQGSPGTASPGRVPAPVAPAPAPVPVPVPAAAPPASASNDGDHPGPWKLKTNFGLTYEFPDTRGLRSWLSSREELDGYTVSADDGASFLPLSGFPQLSRAAGRPAMPSGNMGMPSGYGSGLNQSPTGSGQFVDPTQGPPGDPYQSGLNRDPAGTSSNGVKGPKVNAEYRPPSREAQSRGLLWLVFLILLVIAIAVGLETFGIFKLSDVARDLGLLPKEVNTTLRNKPVSDQTVTAPVVDVEALAKQQDAQAEKFLKDARRLIKNNKLPAALEKLETTQKVAPENVEVHDLMADVYDKLGQSEEAAASRVKAEELRGSQAPPEDEEGKEGATEGEGTLPPSDGNPSSDKPK